MIFLKLVLDVQQVQLSNGRHYYNPHAELKVACNLHDILEIGFGCPTGIVIQWLPLL